MNFPQPVNDFFQDEWNWVYAHPGATLAALLVEFVVTIEIITVCSLDRVVLCSPSELVTRILCKAGSEVAMLEHNHFQDDYCLSNKP